MNQFSKTLLPFVICFFVILIGCTNKKTSREFSHTTEDGGRVNIKIEYKPKSRISGDDKFGSYYYIIQYFDPKPSPSAKTQEQQGKPKTFDSRSIVDHYRRTSKQQGKPKNPPRIEISFYDRKGYSLFKNLSSNTLAPGWNHNEDEKNKIKGGWEWKGHFDESYITIENFRDIHSIKVKTYGLR